MRSCLAALAFAGSVLATSAGAETRIFIIANNADGYGIDRCLANGERCGKLVANAYCQSQSFAEVKSFRKVEREEITGAIPVQVQSTCRGACDAFVAIECAR
jgi:hypothetical protein